MPKRPLLALALLPLLAAAGPDRAPKLIPGGIDQAEPDGNTIVLEDAGGLVVVDTGRHKEHRARILAYARERGLPIRYIVNTHWHLDHSGGNQELREAYPAAKIVTGRAVYGAIDGFLARNLERAKARYADPATPADQKASIALFLEAMDHRKDLLPDVPVTGTMKLGRLELHLADHAATAGDTWLYDSASDTLVSGDLVVLPVPYFDTACAEGWRRSLDTIAGHRFTALIPGHGPALSRAQFETYRIAFGRLVDCAESSAPARACIEGWQKDAAPFLTDPKDRDYAAQAIAYYLDNSLRAPGRQAALCGTAG
ncbi:MBL fold metallo-hydrolase [Sphingomonas sp.]|uniref:MBL fold metallo-hydrolase n=1 Tax=Sphingomonas sp. TaxID=28214 RepID=UPI001B27290E|nr:MBL fold metallo-hydrolase [Sphingomonas sp.]MBO9714012.1 MBL fold metallo-hydrolase [Sphingomonas sp.]